MRTAATCLLVLLCGCGPKPAAESPGTEPAGGGGGGEPAAVGETGDAVVEFFGVRYTVTAKPTQDIDDFGLLVRVTAEITDGKDHGFVRDTVETSEGKTSLRFEGMFGSSEYEEDDFSGKMELEMHSPGSPLVFERTFPGPKDAPLKRGQSVDLTVAVWGTEDAEGGQRYSPELATVSMTVPDSGLADPQIAVLDPGQNLPEDFISWNIWLHKLVVKPYYPNKHLTKTGGGETVAVYSVGDVTVRVQEYKLVVDEKFYGSMAKDESILVDHGKVWVGMEERQPEPMTQEELLEFYPVPMSEHEMGPHKVKKTPGATKYGVSHAGKNYRLVLDGMVLMIEDGYLYKDDVCYGKVPGKATIHINFDEVKVGKQKRKPTDKCGK
jgi:hypothetical protein